MSNLRNTIGRLASDFARQLVSSLRAASIEDLASMTGQSRPPSRKEARIARRQSAKTGRLRRRTSEDLTTMVRQIASVLAKSEAGLRAEQIREALGVSPKELPRPLREGLAAGHLTKTGQRRATRYFAATGGEPTVGAMATPARKRTRKPRARKNG